MQYEPAGVKRCKEYVAPALAVDRIGRPSGAVSDSPTSKDRPVLAVAFPSCDETLLARLPLPLAQLYRRAAGLVSVPNHYADAMLSYGQALPKAAMPARLT